MANSKVPICGLPKAVEMSSLPVMCLYIYSSVPRRAPYANFGALVTIFGQHQSQK